MAPRNKSNRNTKSNEQPKQADPDITTVDKAVAEVTQGTPSVAVRFGERLKAATAAAMMALSGVAAGESEITSLETQILQKRSGNGAKLHELARECVKLTLSEDGKTANLLDAADLMEAACKEAEEDCVARYKREHNGVEAKIAQIVKSWPVMRSTIISAMRKAKIDPNLFPQYTGVENAYKEWKEKNPDQVASQGRKPQTPTAPATLSKPVAETASKLNKVGDNARSAIAALVNAVQLKGPKSQARAAEMISALTKQINALDEDKEEAPAPRRAPIPARVPTSNQVAL